jgi:hypothetical protein
VKALEAADAAKRLAEKKEIDRKIKKEALKVERARLERENLRQLELQNKRREKESVWRNHIGSGKNMTRSYVVRKKKEN